MDWRRADLLEVIDLSERQVVKLFKDGIVIPSVKVPSNRGSEALYSDEDLLLLLVIEILANMFGRVRLDLARAAQRAMSKGAGRGEILVLEAAGGGYLAAPEIVASELAEARGRILVSIDVVQAELDDRIRRQGRRAA
jgi:hypothetical protein